MLRLKGRVSFALSSERGYEIERGGFVQKIPKQRSVPKDFLFSSGDKYGKIEVSSNKLL